MNESDIERLLRQQAPEIPARPGLELRIKSALRGQPAGSRTWLWWAIPATALIALLLTLAPQKEAPESKLVLELPEPPSIAQDDLVPNPLGNEAKAIRNDAERTGRFLIDCLPSLSLADR